MNVGLLTLIVIKKSPLFPPPSAHSKTQIDVSESCQNARSFLLQAAT